MTPFVINSFYTFNTLAPAVLGASFVNAKLIGMVDYSTACTMMNVDLKHRTIYPILPTGTPDTPSKYTYLVFQSESGIKVVVAQQWIDLASVQLVDSAIITVTLPNVTSSDAEQISQALTLLGYSGFTINIT